MAKANRTTSTPRRATAAKAANEPLLPLWRTVRAAWAAEAAINRGPDGTDADEGEDGPALRAYRAAADAFNKVKPTTTLGLFLTLLNSDEGDDFADEHPAAEAIIAQLQAANVSLRSLAKAKRGCTVTRAPNRRAFLAGSLAIPAAIVLPATPVDRIKEAARTRPLRCRLATAAGGSPMSITPRALHSCSLGSTGRGCTVSARRKWIDVGNGVRMRQPTKTEANFHRQQKAQNVAMQHRIEADTCGLGDWRQPQGWGSEPFSHTVTMVADNMGHMGGWQIYNCGVVVTLTVHPIEGPFTRGAPYVWCKAAHDRNGNSGIYPTAPLFGRFIEWSGDRPKVLAGPGASAELGADYVYCFRAVGMVGHDAERYTRSEIPVPIPDKAERLDGPAAFDALQYAAKHLGSS